MYQRTDLPLPTAAIWRGSPQAPLPLAVLLSATPAAADDVQTCPVTIPVRSSVEVPGMPESSGSRVWYGDADLAVLLPADGRWYGLGAAQRFRDKSWWWRSGYDASTEITPDLVIDADRLDSRDPAAPHVRVNEATNAFGDDWNAILVGLEFPAAGCWRVTGTYQGHALTFVVAVADRPAFASD